jgi:hypothetical protein
MLFFIKDCHSASLTRIAFSFTGTEIMTAANAADSGFALSAIFRQFESTPDKVLFELTLDSRDALGTMMTLHEGENFGLRPTVCRIRDAFSSGEFNTKCAGHQVLRTSQTCYQSAARPIILSSTTSLLPQFYRVI